MANLRAVGPMQSAGFDPSRSLLVMPLGAVRELFLVAGKDLSLDLPSPVSSVGERSLQRNEKASNQLSSWERAQNLRVLRLTGSALGNATLNAFLPGTTTPFIAPLTIRVTADKDSRQAGEESGKPIISSELMHELEGMAPRDALIRLAEDQMNSTIGHTPHGGFGAWGLPAKGPDGKAMNWCGAWVQWLYQRVSSIQKFDNPFEDNPHTLATPQKAIGFALHRPQRLQVLEYGGPDQFGWTWPPRGSKEKVVADKPGLSATYQAHTPVSGPPRRGDICLLRDAQNWRHVCMVLTTPDASGAFMTFDGNQYHGPNGYCICTTHRNALDRVGGARKFAFIATDLPGDENYNPPSLSDALLYP